MLVTIHSNVEKRSARAGDGGWKIMTTNHPDPTPPPAEPAPSLRPVEEIRDIHGSSGCKPILRGDELGDFYECCCGWRSDAGTGVGIARTRLAAADRENAELRGLLSRVARSAVRYDQRVYRLTDDFAALAPFLSEDDIAAAGERPSETDARVETERDDLRAQLAAAQAQLARADAVLRDYLRLGPVEVFAQLLADRAALSAAPQPEPDVRAAYSESLRRLGRADLAPDDFRLADLEEFDYGATPEPPASDEPARNRCTCDRAKEGAAFHHPTCPSYTPDGPR